MAEPSRTTTVSPDADGSISRRAAHLLRRGVRQVIRREWVDEAFDWTRLRIDTLGAADYQPVSADPAKGAANRVSGTLSRWEAMEPLVAELGVRSAVDIGCNVGWFVRNLALRGIPSVGVEGHPPLYRTAMYTARKDGDGLMAVLPLHVTPENVSLVPHADCTIFLAVWHHLVRHQGLEAADAVLSALWRSTGTVLFFETGEDLEMPEYYRLPAMTPDAPTWIASHLEQACPGGTVRHLGLHASSPTYSRNLFALVRAGARD